MAAAAPARSGGALPIIMSVASVNTGEEPTEMMIIATTMRTGLESTVSRGGLPGPAAAIAMPDAITYAGRNLRTTNGLRMEATIKPPANGIAQKPASSGD